MATRPSTGGDGVGAYPRAWRLLSAAAIGLISVSVLAGCGAKGDKGSLEAAKAAIAADPDLEIVATDEANGVITVRIKSSGQITVVKASDLKPGVALVVKPAAPAAPPAAEAAAPAATSRPAASVSVQGGNAGVSVKGGGGAQGSVQASSGGGIEMKDASGSITLKDGKIQARQGGQGVTLDASGVTLNPDGSVSLGGGAVKVGGGGSAGGAAAGGGTTAAREKTKRTSPVFCRAASEVRLDNVFLDVAGGDAINAEGGCTLWIRHSHVSAGGWGLIVQGGATIIIEDSLIEGRTGSMNIQDGGEVSSLASTFRGRFTRRPEAEFKDKGGNNFQ